MIDEATYTLIKLGDANCDLFRVLATLSLVQASFVLDDLAEEECQKFLVVAGLGEVLAEALRNKKSVTKLITVHGKECEPFPVFS